MRLSYNVIVRMMDSLDEFISNLNTYDPQVLVDRKVASNIEVAKRFMDLYPKEPDRALISLIVDRYHPDRLYSNTGKSSWIILTAYPQCNPTETYLLNYINRKRQGIINRLNRPAHSGRHHKCETATAAAL